MNFIKGAADGGQVDKIIDQAADVAKEKVGAMIGGDKKKAGGAKDQKGAGGVGDVLSGAVGKAATDAAAKSAADQAMDIGKKMFH
ncbi:hypothetical protein QQF64_004779 [Cirrhinus molitorella]|uniref:Uncharacterized protein n=2 Tax=Cirrhinus molitorella TaxID=172907 RepID=A0ABR3MH74_9TELE|nr:hypothetical protein Q8A67_020529 [Cirrhinus molitorella]